MNKEEDRSKPNPDWVSVPYGLAHGFEVRDGKWTRVTYKMQDGKMIEIENEEDHTQPRIR